MLTEWASWRWVMFVNVPIGIAVYVAGRLFLDETPRQRVRFDVAGAITSTLGMTSLVYGFVHAAAHGWTNTRDAGGLRARRRAAGGVRLHRAPRRGTDHAAHPVRRPHAQRCYLARMLLIAGMTGMFFFLTQFMQDVLGYSPLATGFGFLPITICLFIASQASARVLVERFGERPVMIAGVALSTLGLLWLTGLSASSGYLSVLGPLDPGRARQRQRLCAADGRRPQRRRSRSTPVPLPGSST